MRDHLKRTYCKKIIVAETNLKRNIQHDSSTVWNCFFFFFEKRNYEKGIRTVASRSLENKNNPHINSRYTFFFNFSEAQRVHSKV